MNEKKRIGFLVVKAKETLRENGYYVDNLWHVEDVKLKYKKASTEEAQNILKVALSNEATMEQIWFAIDDAIEAKFEDGLDTDYED
jgi:hypothetical protein